MLKRFIFWDYPRASRPYDLIVGVILAFIFLTPQSWFDSVSAMKNWSNGEPAGGEGHQKPVASRIILPVGGSFPAQMAQNEIENRVRALTGRTNTEVLNVVPRLDASGKIVAYEVDIR